ncbi:unnamed protein product [Amoebophrya sp. A120]|nr:unnamed protein product [Amoebophrya sp. A120]|eukprot:GSA120T00009878001.1
MQSRAAVAVKIMSSRGHFIRTTRRTSFLSAVRKMLKHVVVLFFLPHDQDLHWTACNIFSPAQIKIHQVAAMEMGASSKSKSQKAKTAAHQMLKRSTSTASSKTAKMERTTTKKNSLSTSSTTGRAASGMMSLSKQKQTSTSHQQIKLASSSRQLAPIRQLDTMSFSLKQFVQQKRQHLSDAQLQKLYRLTNNPKKNFEEDVALELLGDEIGKQCQELHGGSTASSSGRAPQGSDDRMLRSTTSNHLPQRSSRTIDVVTFWSSKGGDEDLRNQLRSYERFGGSTASSSGRAPQGPDDRMLRTSSSGRAPQGPDDRMLRSTSNHLPQRNRTIDVVTFWSSKGGDEDLRNQLRSYERFGLLNQVGRIFILGEELDKAPAWLDETTVEFVSLTDQQIKLAKAAAGRDRINAAESTSESSSQLLRTSAAQEDEHHQRLQESALYNYQEQKQQSTSLEDMQREVSESTSARTKKQLRFVYVEPCGNKEQSHNGEVVHQTKSANTLCKEQAMAFLPDLSPFFLFLPDDNFLVQDVAAAGAAPAVAPEIIIPKQGDEEEETTSLSTRGATSSKINFFANGQNTFFDKAGKLMLYKHGRDDGPPGYCLHRPGFAELHGVSVLSKCALQTTVAFFENLARSTKTTTGGNVVNPHGSEVEDHDEGNNESFFITRTPANEEQEHEGEQAVLEGVRREKSRKARTISPADLHDQQLHDEKMLMSTKVDIDDPAGPEQGTSSKRGEIAEASADQVTLLLEQGKKNLHTAGTAPSTDGGAPSSTSSGDGEESNYPSIQAPLEAREQDDRNSYADFNPVCIAGHAMQIGCADCLSENRFRLLNENNLFHLCHSRGAANDCDPAEVVKRKKTFFMNIQGKGISKEYGDVPEKKFSTFFQTMFPKPSRFEKKEKIEAIRKKTRQQGEHESNHTGRSFQSFVREQGRQFSDFVANQAIRARDLLSFFVHEVLLKRPIFF